MRRNDLDLASGFRNAMQLIHETKNVRNMLDDVATNDFLKLVVSERIWKRSEIVNDVCMTQSICIDTDRAGKLILTTTDVENLR